MLYVLYMYYTRLLAMITGNRGRPRGAVQWKLYVWTRYGKRLGCMMMYACYTTSVSACAKKMGVANFRSLERLNVLDGPPGDGLTQELMRKAPLHPGLILSRPVDAPDEVPFEVDPAYQYL